MPSGREALGSGATACSGLPRGILPLARPVLGHGSSRQSPGAIALELALFKVSGGSGHVGIPQTSSGRMPDPALLGVTAGDMLLLEPDARRRSMRTSRSRLTTPLVRDGDALREASWDEALGRAAEGFARAREAGATTSFGMFSCSKATNEMNFLAQKFARQVMGSNNVDSCNRT
jgi:formate dehydrogenase major subunit